MRTIFSSNQPPLVIVQKTMHLKTSFCLLLSLVSAPAQNPAVSPPPEPVVVTNRDVFQEVVALPPKQLDRASHGQILRGEVLECRSNVLVLRTFELKNIYGPVPPSTWSGLENSGNPLHQPAPMRPVVGQKKKYGAVIALRNFKSLGAVTNGQEWVGRAIVTGTYPWRDSLIELYDGGWRE